MAESDIYNITSAWLGMPYDTEHSSFADDTGRTLVSKIVPGHPEQQLATRPGGYTHGLRYVFDNFDSFHNQQPHKQTEHGKRHSDSDLYKSRDLLAIIHHRGAAA